MVKSSDHDIEIRQRIVGAFLKDCRIKKGLTQEQVAKQLRYSTPQFVSNWERGLSQPPLDVLPDLASYYGVDSDEIIQVLTCYQEELLIQFKKDLKSVFK